VSLHDDIDDFKELTRMIISDKKEEKERQEREQRTVQLICPYCGTSSRIVWEEGTLPNCPSCGAVFSADDPQLVKAREELDEKASARRRAQEAAAIESAKTKSKIKKFVILGIVLVVLLIAAVVAAKLMGGNMHMEGGASFDFHIS
jgi:nitrate reductase NapE component